MKALNRRWFLGGMTFAGLARAADELRQVPTVHDNIRAAADEAALGMMFKGSTPKELATWQKQFRAKVTELLGPHAPPPKWSTEKLSAAEFADFTREEFLLNAKGAASLPVYVLRPKGARRGRLPVLLCLHGHGEFGHDAVAGIDHTPERAANIKKANYDYARQLAREGFITVAPCMRPFGRRLDASSRKGRTDPCAVTFVRLMLLGQTLMGANLRDCKWALDFAATLPGVDIDRCGCVGLSYGGRMTMLVAAMDLRVKAAVVSGALNVMQERIGLRYSCGAQVIPGLLKHGDTPELGGLIAPRPCIWEIGSDDGLIIPGWDEKMKTRIQRAYTASKKPKAVTFHHFKGDHRWDGTKAVPMLKRVLG